VVKTPWSMSMVVHRDAVDTNIAPRSSWVYLWRAFRPRERRPCRNTRRRRNQRQLRLSLCLFSQQERLHSQCRRSEYSLTLLRWRTSRPRAQKQPANKSKLFTAEAVCSQHGTASGPSRGELFDHEGGGHDETASEEGPYDGGSSQQRQSVHSTSGPSRGELLDHEGGGHDETAGEEGPDDGGSADAFLGEGGRKQLADADKPGNH